LARHILEGAPATSVLTSGKVDATAKPTPDKPVVAIAAAPNGLSAKSAPQNTKAPAATKTTDRRVGLHQRP
jgi:hypothetical protein